ncbi:hypothetical protein N9N28_16925, partial [Rubripirellula amarantea]|nr:hypothetical protein [Rubripirellula amarantea]
MSFNSDSGSRTPSYPSDCKGEGIPKPKNTLNARTGGSTASEAIAADENISSNTGSPTMVP